MNFTFPVRTSSEIEYPFASFCQAINIKKVKAMLLLVDNSGN